MNTSLVLSLALIVGAPAKEAPKKEEPSVVGEWVAESGVVAGEVMPKNEKLPTFIFTKDGKLTVVEGNKKDKDDTGGYKIDTTKKPAELDLIPPPAVKDRNILAIFKIEGDTLTICAKRDGTRPTEFVSTKENQAMLIVLKRVKKD